MSVTIYAILAGIGAALLAVWKAYASGKQTGVSQQKAKEAEGYARNVDKAADAAAARDAVLTGRVRPDDKDPYRRD